MPNNILYIHIGMDKCGSSSIHSYFNDNKTLLEKQNLFYLNTYIFDKIFPIDIKFENYLLKQSKLFKNKDVIISNRDICNNISKLLNNIDFFKEVFRNYIFKIIMYIPRIDDWCKLIYIEHLNNVDVEQRDKHSYLYDFFSMTKQFNLLINTFGKENVIFRIFDKSKLKNNDIISDICEIISKDRHISINLENTIYRRNTNSSNFSIEMPYKISLMTKQTKNNNEHIKKNSDNLYDFSYKTRKECLQVIDNSFNMKYAFYDSPPPIEIINNINKFVPGYSELFNEKPFDLNDNDFKYQKEILCLANLIYLCIDKINELDNSIKNLNKK